MTDASPLFVIGANETRILGDAGHAAENFERCRYVAISGALDRPFLDALLAICNRAQFIPDLVAGIGHREVEIPSRAGGALTLALKRINLLQWLERVTGRGPLQSVDGRVVQAHAGGDDQLLWHNDLDIKRRRLAITVSLTEQHYDGGVFELRGVKTGRLLLQFRHSEPGSALIFDVAHGLEHRVLPLTAGGPRRVYTGWFLGGC